MIVVCVWHVCVLKELKEEHTRVLTAVNPHAPQNIVRFNFKVSRHHSSLAKLLDLCANECHDREHHSDCVC